MTVGARLALLASAMCLSAACEAETAASPSPATTAPSTGSAVVRVKGEAWADNWFAFYIGDLKIAEDSVPITTERSFNAETFTFETTLPFTASLILRDYIQNDTGLEYIGTPNQQMGDGGFILQFTNAATGAVIGVTDARMRCLVVHAAPLNASCEKSPTPETSCQSRLLPEPAGWTLPGFDDTAWPQASVYTPAQVGVKDGYTTIRWDPTARLVWSSDLKVDNTLLCRLRVER
jgi:hypothetical protein